jgi:hypothetical protein
MNELNDRYFREEKTHSEVCGPVIRERTIEGEQTTYVFLYPANAVAEQVRLHKEYPQREAQFKAFFAKEGWEW